MSQDNTFRGGDFSGQGGMFFVKGEQSVSFTEEGSDYSWCQAVNGGAIYLELPSESFATIKNAKFYNNRARDGAAVLVNYGEFID
jgi:hypothetical protein